MSFPLNSPVIEIHVPDAESEREFLRLAVQAAAKKYRETHRNPINPPQAICAEGQVLPQSVR